MKKFQLQNDIKTIIQEEHLKTRFEIVKNRGILKSIAEQLDESEKKELDMLVNNIDNPSANLESIVSLLNQMQDALAEIQGQVKRQYAKQLSVMQTEIDKEPSPKHKLKLALNLLFIKYEIEYDALATFRQIKEDISKGNWFLKQD